MGSMVCGLSAVEAVIEVEAVVIPLQPLQPLPPLLLLPIWYLRLASPHGFLTCL